MRLDRYLAETGRTSSREKAAERIRAGAVLVNGKVISKPSAEVSDADEIRISENSRYVGRGGYKLEKALSVFPVSVSGKVCLDVGASTGGFTDCMLQHGAAQVFAVDVGTGQLVSSLRADSRVVSLEKTDIRTLSPFAVDFVCADVSFISLTYILPALRTFLPEGGDAVVLVKPQFEVGRHRLKNGIVTDRSLQERAIEDVMCSARASGFSALGLIPSPISGGDGNREFLLYLKAGSFVEHALNIRTVVRSATSEKEV